jgi:hypothetical protein
MKHTETHTNGRGDSAALNLRNTLRHHVTGAIERGEAVAITEQPAARSPYQPKTGQRCFCRKGIARDNCPSCEGTGWQIDFAAIRARRLVAGSVIMELLTVLLIFATGFLLLAL